jgi:UDP-3-O-[3-hydroxymyristoyl] glucosamine N-acyltransferase
MKIAEIISRFNLTAHIPEGKSIEAEIHSVAAIDKVKAGQISFFSSAEFAHHLPASQATALVVREVQPGFSGVQLVHKDPQFIFAKLALDFYKPDHGPLGIHEKAYVDPGANIGKDVRIHPGAHIEDRAVIGDRVVIYPGVFVGKGVKIGADSVLHPNVVVYNDCIIGLRALIHAGTVIGADGFGFAVSGGEVCKIPQVGIVRIGNDVEIGALCTIDRAANTETIIHDFCKFDDRVHIAHNCEIGANSMFSAQVGIAGSTTVGKWTVIGGQSGIADHLKVGDGMRIASKTAVLQNLTERGTYAGIPAIPLNEWKRQVVYIKRLKDYDQAIKRLEKRLNELEQRSED